MHRDSGSSFVMGMAAGAVAVSLYTPVAGAALRKRLNRYAAEGADMAVERVAAIDWRAGISQA